MEPIRKNFRIRVADYPMFLQLDRKGTIVGTETNRYLRQKGITHYSGTGVGERIPWKEHHLYQYVLAHQRRLHEDTTWSTRSTSSAAP